MLRRIRDHNYLNGQVLSFVEYLFVAAVVALFLVYYLANGRTLYALVAIGIVLNCLTVSAVALVSLLRGERSIGAMRLWRDRELRRKIAREYPHLSQDTVVLSITVLIPYWIFGAAVLNAFSKSA
jgi:hypothetical protein